MKKDVLVEILKNDFDRKRKRNPAYSLRSYARDLGVDPSNLSKILSYQKAVGPKLKTKLAQQIGLEADELESLEKGRPANITDSHYKRHSLEVFEIISSWQHYAILELLKIPNFEADPIFISQRLNISISDAKASFERLKKVGLVSKPGRQWIPTENSSSSVLDITTSKAHRNQQKQILEGAIDALDKTDPHYRSQSSMTIAIDRSKLVEARELIKQFRRELGRYLSDSTDLDEVYQLSISLYPVTN